MPPTTTANPDALRPVVLITRPLDRARVFAEELPESVRSRAEILCCPLIEIESIGTLPEMADYRGLIFTSANGVAAYAARGGRTDLPCFAVGGATAKAAAKAGFKASSADGNADDLVTLILRSHPSGPLLHVRGKHGAGDVAKRLTEGGVRTDETVLYEQKLLGLSEEAKAALSQDRQVVVPLFSPRTARGFFAEHPPANRLWIAAISRAVAAEVPEDLVERLEIAEKPNGQEMLKLVSRFVGEASRG